MEFYIEPDSAEEDFLRVAGPEEITFCDPACGSGHILVYAFQLLTEMYRERGWRDRDIARSILEKNLSGYEIDPRAAQIAQTALCMEALALDRRWLTRGVTADVRVLQNIELDEEQLPETYVKKDLADAIRHLGEVGSLVNPSEADLAALDAAIADASAADLLGATLCKQLQEARSQLEALSRQFDIVVANPPYLGNKSFQPFLTKWMRDNYPDEKSDLCYAFINRICGMKKPGGEAGITATNSWMFLSSSEASRKKTLDKNEITSLVQLSVHGFKGIAAQIFAFTLIDKQSCGYKGGYVRLNDFDHHSLQEAKTLEAIQNPDCGWFYRADASTFHDIPGSPIAYWARLNDFDHHSLQEAKTLEAIQNPDCGWFYRADASTFHDIPGSPIAYWASEAVVSAFLLPAASCLYDIKSGIRSGDNERFLRFWHEVQLSKCSFVQNDAHNLAKWFPSNKGEGYRRWYGNNFRVVNWEHDGKEIREFPGSDASPTRKLDWIGSNGLTWGTLSSGPFSARQSVEGAVPDAKGAMVYQGGSDLPLETILGLLNSSVVQHLLGLIAPTLDYKVGSIQDLPVHPIALASEKASELVQKSISLSKTDYDSQETSWDFKRNPLL